VRLRERVRVSDEEVRDELGVRVGEDEELRVRLRDDEELGVRLRLTVRLKEDDEEVRLTDEVGLGKQSYEVGVLA
jgi:hypothetical protein